MVDVLYQHVEACPPVPPNFETCADYRSLVSR